MLSERGIILNYERRERKPIRVLQACDLRAGGITSLILSICEELDREKVNFDYLVFRDQEEFGDNRVKTLGGKKLIADNEDAPGKIAKFLWKFFRTWKVLRAEKTEIFHINGSVPYDCLMGLAAKAAGCKTVILHCHNSHLKKSGKGHQIFQQICRMCIPLCGDYYFACSDLAGRFMYGKRLQKKVVYVKNGIHTEIFRFDEKGRENLRKRYGVENAWIIGSIGRMCKAKNQKFLLDIFGEILKQKPEARLLLIGQGELEEELMNQADSMGIREKLIHIASTDKVSQFLSMMDVFLLPSLFEGFPIVGVEAQASGLPCIFSKNITKQAAITDRAYFLSLKRSAFQWAKFALTVWKKDAARRSEYAEQVRKAGYEIQDTARWLQEFYMKV